jgi:hypothetical protein
LVMLRVLYPFTRYGEHSVLDGGHVPASDPMPSPKDTGRSEGRHASQVHAALVLAAVLPRDSTASHGYLCFSVVQIAKPMSAQFISSFSLFFAKGGPEAVAARAAHCHRNLSETSARPVD